MSTRKKLNVVAKLYALKSLLTAYLGRSKGTYPINTDGSSASAGICLECNSLLGNDWGKAEPDFSGEFCSIECVLNHISDLRKFLVILEAQNKVQKQNLRDLLLSDVSTLSN
jgi:hypothetical protein|tara:strand:- start:1721 stop:2056 length:336 start_codon:yes stop_codon:yes gene_type:complete